MVTRGLLYKFFLRALSAVHWNKVGSKRIEVMMKEIPKILEMLARYIERDARFILKYGNQTFLADKVTCVPHNWHMDLADPKDVDINQNVYTFLALMQSQAKCAQFDEASLNRLLENIPLATYVLTNFFLNSGKHFIEVPTVPYMASHTVRCKSGADTEADATANPPKGGGLCYSLRGSQPFMEALATAKFRVATARVSDFGFYGPVTHEEFHQRIRNLGFFLCPLQLSWQLIEDRMFVDHPADETLKVMADGIELDYDYHREENRKIPKDKGHSTVEFYTEATGKGFRCCDGHVSDLLAPNTLVLFCLDNPYPPKDTYGQWVQNVDDAWTAAGGDIRLARIERDKQVEAERWDPDRVNPRTFDSLRPGMTGTSPRVKEDCHGL